MPGFGYRFIGDVRIDLPKTPDAVTVPPPDPPRASELSRPLRWRAWGAVALASLALAGVLFSLGTAEAPLRIGRAIQLTSSPDAKLSPLVSDSHGLFYQRQEGTHFELAQLPFQGGEPAVFPTSVGNPDLCDISADRSALLVRGIGVSRDHEAPMFLAPIAGGIAKPVGDLKAVDFTLSADGREVIFAHGNELLKTTPQGGPPRTFAKLPGKAYWPRWSPDGKRLRFTLIAASSYATSLWEVSSRGSDAHSLFEKKQPFGIACCGNWNLRGDYFFQAKIDGANHIWYLPERRFALNHERNDPVQLTIGAMSYAGPLPSARTDRASMRGVRFNAVN